MSNKNIIFPCWLAGAAATLVLAMASSSATANGIVAYAESGDAGDTFGTAQALTGGPYNSISGTVGGIVNATASPDGAEVIFTKAALLPGSVGDPADFFYFGFGGGNLTMFFSECVGCGSVANVEAELFNAQQNVMGQIYYTQSVTMNGLSAGNYYLAVSAPSDPPFTVTFTGPSTSLPIAAPFATTPEPSALALFAIGFAGLGFNRRKRA